MRRKLWVIWKLLFAKHWYFCSFKDADGWQWHQGLKLHQAQAIVSKLKSDIVNQVDQENALNEVNSIINKK